MSSSSSKKRALDVSVVPTVVDYDGSVAIAQAASDAAVAQQQQPISLEPPTTAMDHDGKLALEPIDVPELPPHQHQRASQRLKAKQEAAPVAPESKPEKKSKGKKRK